MPNPPPPSLLSGLWVRGGPRRAQRRAQSGSPSPEKLTGRSAGPEDPHAERSGGGGQPLPHLSAPPPGPPTLRPPPGYRAVPQAQHSRAAARFGASPYLRGDAVGVGRAQGERSGGLASPRPALPAHGTPPPAAAAPAHEAGCGPALPELPGDPRPGRVSSSPLV